MRAAVLGASGYTGGELLRLLFDHPEVEVTQVTSERLAGKQLTSIHPHLRGRTELRFQANQDVDQVDVLFNARRHGEAARSAGWMLELAPITVDLSADFRLRNPADYVRWYGWEHPEPSLLAEFGYALPELHRETLPAQPRLAAGGCVATASILGMAPLFRAGIVDDSKPVVIDALVGSSAAGATPGPTSHHPYRSGSIHSFSAIGHRHTAEIAQELHIPAERVALSVTSVEAVRGIHTTAHIWLKDRLDDKDLWKVYRAMSSVEPFFRVVKQSQGIHRNPDPKLLAGTNFCDVGFVADSDSPRIVVNAAIDNLVKGAAGQAVHAFNIHKGLDEMAGLGFTGLFPS